MAKTPTPKKTNQTKAKQNKNKTYLYAAYKRLISDLETQADRKMKGWKSIYHANGCEKKARVAIFILDKIDLKKKLQQETKKDSI